MLFRSVGEALSIVAVDNAGNRTTHNVKIDWFNDTVSTEARNDKPSLVSKLMKVVTGGTDVEIIDSTIFTKNDKAYISAIATASTTAGSVAPTIEVKSIVVNEEGGVTTGDVSATNGNYDVTNNGWYYIVAKDGEPYHDQWTAQMIEMSKIDSSLPTITISKQDVTEQSSQAENPILEWSASKKQTGTSVVSIQSVTINGKAMDIGTGKTSVAGVFEATHGGEYVAKVVDTNGNETTATYTLSNVEVKLDSGKTQEDLCGIVNSWGEDGKITIKDTGIFIGGNYKLALSSDDKAANNYSGLYEWTLVKAEEILAGDSLKTLLEDKTITWRSEERRVGKEC